MYYWYAVFETSSELLVWVCGIFIHQTEEGAKRELESVVENSVWLRSKGVPHGSELIECGSVCCIGRC